MDKDTSNQPDEDVKRKFKNYFLDPILQIRFGLYSILMTILFSLTIAAILYVHLGKFATIIVELTGVQDEVIELLNSYLEGAQWWILATIIAYVVASVFMAVFFTHRLIGPVYSFKKHIDELTAGDYSYQTKLRRGDAFDYVAESLNKLSEKLRENSNKRP